MSWIRLPVALAAILMAASTVHVERAAPPTSRPNVLLVTIDTLRADRLGSYGYRLARTPVLDALARAGVRFADVTAHVPLTFPSHVAILTGRYPAPLGVRVNGLTLLPPNIPTLATRFKAAGYGTAAFISSAILDQSYGLNRGFDLYDADMKRNPKASVALAELQRPAGQVVGSVLRWLDRRPRQPWFAWVHLFDPHYPYEPPPAYLKLAGGRAYDGEVTYADASLGLLLARLDPASTIVLVTSDHGESLGEHGEEDHGFFLYDSTLKVPMILRGPGLAPRVVTEQVRSIDVAPTLAALAGLASDPGDDGESLVPLARGGTRPAVPPSYAETWYPRFQFAWSELRSIRVGEWKYIAAPRPELFDLRTDARELNNLVAQKGTVAGRLASDLSVIARAADPAPGRPAGSPQPQPDPESIRRLQALGYVGTFAPATASSSAIDPKDRLADYKDYRRRLSQALDALDRGEPTAAVAILKKLLVSNVRAFEVHLYLGNAYAMMQQYEPSLAEYDVAHQLNPDLAQVHFEAAKALSMKGDGRAAATRCREGLALEPTSVYGLFTLGVIHEKAGQYDEAADAFQKAVAADGSDPRPRASLAGVAMRLGRANLARPQYEAMIALGYRVAPAEFNLGFIAEGAGDLELARKHYRAALAANPAFKPAIDALAKLRRRTGR